jgi:uroporphyrinogen-III decarboxylase
MSYYFGLTNFAALDNPEMEAAMQAIVNARKQASQIVKGAGEFAAKMKGLGYPPQVGAFSQVPFDTISDFFRGTRGAMLDMYRHPDKLLAAIDKMGVIMLRMGISGAERTGCPRVFIPLHKGQEYFMSEAQFKKFYWPGFQKLMLGLIDAGLNPAPLVEGDYTSRLDIIKDIPAGKVCYRFESTDIFKAKKILGKTACIQGNVPMSLMCTGTPEQVKEYCKRLIDEVAVDGGYIMDSAVGLDDAKIVNVRALYDFTREYGVYH